MSFPAHRELSDADVVAMAELVAAQLSDTNSPLVCPVCVYRLAGALGSSIFEATTVRLAQTHHAFWTACAAMVSAPGTTGSVTRLRSILDDNATACRNEWHVGRFVSFRDHVAALMDALCMCIAACLDRGPHRIRSAILRSKRGMWPTSLGDIVPSGLGPYVRWACVLPTPAPLKIITRIFFVARRAAMKDLTVAPSQERLVTKLICILQQCDATDPESPALPHHRVHDVALPPATREDSRASQSQAYELVLWFLAGPDRHFDDIADFARGYEASLHDAILHFASFATATDSSQLYALVAVASIIASAARLPLHPLVVQFRESPDADQVYDTVTVGQAVYLYANQGSLLCAGPGCNRNTRYGSTRSPALCSSCRSVRYCGTECQRLDWRHGRDGIPHKAICVALRKLVDPDPFEPRPSMPDFVEAYEDPNVLTQEERRILGQVALTSGVLPSRFKAIIPGMLERISDVGGKGV